MQLVILINFQKSRPASLWAWLTSTPFGALRADIGTAWRDVQKHLLLILQDLSKDDLL